MEKHLRKRILGYIGQHGYRSTYEVCSTIQGCTIERLTELAQAGDIVSDDSGWRTVVGGDPNDEWEAKSKSGGSFGGPIGKDDDRYGGPIGSPVNGNYGGPIGGRPL
jgi:hypothetical protein